MTARLRIPDRVTLRGRVWTITRPVECSRDPDNMGFCDPEPRQIEIRAGLSDADALETYLHECLHAVFPHRVLSDRLEEAVICNLDEGLVDAVLALVGEEG